MSEARDGRKGSEEKTKMVVGDGGVGVQSAGVLTPRDSSAGARWAGRARAAAASTFAAGCPEQRG